MDDFRIAWLVVFFVTSSCTVYFCVTAYDEYLKNPVVVTLESIALYIGNIPFPTVALLTAKSLTTAAISSVVK
jgi:hypothetical protein